MINLRIGIIGMGYVGKAVKEAYHDSRTDIVLLDPALGYYGSYEDTIKNTDAVFVCVPSPTKEDGTCDISILDSVLNNLKRVKYRNLVISKVTADPRYYQNANEEMPNLVHIPEFLTAANSIRDYIHASTVIIGGSVNAYIKDAERIVRLGQPHIEDVLFCSIAEAAYAKYVINCYLATKVVFLNEIQSLAETLGYDYAMIRRLITSDPRIGSSHTQVPGPDGSYGFGGACFPKDTAAFLSLAQSAGSPLELLETAIKKNTLLRLKNND